jgi:hypothetical protein
VRRGFYRHFYRVEAGGSSSGLANVRAALACMPGIPSWIAVVLPGRGPVRPRRIELRREGSDGAARFAMVAEEFGGE